MKQKSLKQILDFKIRLNRCAKIICKFFAWLFSLIFVALIGYIIYESIPGWKAYGSSILFSSSYDLPSHKASVWLPLSITLLVVVGAMLVAVPLAIKTATFIKFRVKSPKTQKILRVAIETMAGIPSVMFGLFASLSLGKVLSTIFNTDVQYSIITAILMLGFMLLPTIMSLTLNAYDGVDTTFINNSIALGNTKTRAIYKVFRKECRGGIIVAIFIALGRAIGETMALSMILSSDGYNSVFGSGANVLESALRPLGVVIAANMFAESGDPGLIGLLYAFGIVLFVIVMILNAMAIHFTKKKNKIRSTKWILFQRKISNIVLFIPNQISIIWEKMTYKSDIKLTKQNCDVEMNNYLTTRIEKNKTLYFYSGYKLFWEILSVVISFGFLFWITFDILIGGFNAAVLPTSTIFKYSKDTTGQATLNTLLLIVVTIAIGLPFSLLIAIYLNEYAKDGFTKKTVYFFIDSLGATPSILFGMFGLAFFIQTCGISSGGRLGTSLLAGALTLLLVILPTFTRSIQQVLASVPMEIRTSAYGLGSSKWETITKLVLPQAFRGVVSTTILTIGRILAETAPLYLTAGLTSSSVISLLNPGQTLTTRIYAQLNATNALTASQIMYESALVTLFLVILLTIIGHVILPMLPSWIKSIKSWWEMQLIAWKLKPNIPMSKFKKQLIGNKLFLSKSQALELELDNKKNKVMFYKKRIIKIKYINDDELEIMNNVLFSVQQPINNQKVLINHVN